MKGKIIDTDYFFGVITKGGVQQRVTIPKKIIERLGSRPGDDVKIEITIVKRVG